MTIQMKIVGGTPAPLEMVMDSAQFNVGGTNDFNRLNNRPKFNGEEMTGDTNIPEVPENLTQIIPNQATAENQLADKDFVNSSIATATAEFTGTFNSLAELEAVTTADNNDYAFVVEVDAEGNTVYNRYKYNGESWVFEFALNNSSFTAEQWAAIQSGITAPLVQKLSNLELYEAIGQNTDGAMTQKAVTNTLFANGAADRVQIGQNAQALKDNTLAIGRASVAGSTESGIGAGALALGYLATAPRAGSIALGAFSGGADAIPSSGIIAVNSTHTAYGYQGTNYRLLTGLYDGQGDHDAVTKGQMDAAIAAAGSGVELYDTIGTATDGAMTQAATTNMIYSDDDSASAIRIGAGAQITVENKPGVAIGKNATCQKYGVAIGENAKSWGSEWPDGGIAIGMNSLSPAYGVAVGSYARSNNTSVAIGFQASKDGCSQNSVAIGAYSTTNNSSEAGVAIGYQAKLPNNVKGSVAIGAGAGRSITAAGMVDIGSYTTDYGYNSTNYRLLTGLYDGQGANDAATVGQINATIDAINAALGVEIPHIGA